MWQEWMKEYDETIKEIEEIKVGEYVRTTDGNIDYIDAIFEGIINLRKHKWCDDRYIAKHSPNIIELIEERRLYKWFKSYKNKLQTGIY